MTQGLSSASATIGASRLGFEAVIFDVDGVVTRTADLHAAAWKEAFDDFVGAWIASGRPSFAPFDPEADTSRMSTVGRATRASDASSPPVACSSWRVVRPIRRGR